MADWLCVRSVLGSCVRSVLGSIPAGTSSAGCVPMFLLLFFYYFLEHTEHREPLETLIADFLVELGVIRVFHIDKF